MATTITTGGLQNISPRSPFNQGSSTAKGGAVRTNKAKSGAVEVGANKRELLGSSVDYQAGGKVSYEIGGQKFDLTKEQYKNVVNLQAGRGGTLDTTTQEILDIQQRKNAILAEAKAQGITGAENVKEFAQEKEQMQEQALQTAEETGVFEDRPERIELNPTQQDLSRGLTPADIVSVTREDGSIDIEALDKLRAEKNYIQDLINSPETQRQISIQEIQRIELDKAQTISQRIGAFLEPYLGDLKVADVDIGGYVDKFARMPRQEAIEIVEQIKELESRVSGMTDSASQGEIGNPQEVLRDIAKYEEDLARYEARIKKLVIESAELRANPEQVNIIEEEILSARETMFEAKQRAAEGALVTPTNEQLYLKLQQLKK